MTFQVFEDNKKQVMTVEESNQERVMSAAAVLKRKRPSENKDAKNAKKAAVKEKVNTIQVYF